MSGCCPLPPATDLQFECFQSNFSCGSLTRAAELAANAWELTLARTQLAEIRCLRWEGAQRTVLTKPVIVALMLMASAMMTGIGAILLAWK